MSRGLTSDKGKDGFYHFYWNGHDVTGHWMWFFSGLKMKEEKYSAWLYARRHGKELNRQYPMKPSSGAVKTRPTPKDTPKGGGLIK